MVVWWSRGSVWLPLSYHFCEERLTPTLLEKYRLSYYLESLEDALGTAVSNETSYFAVF
jgi:hypothetical protein